MKPAFDRFRRLAESENSLSAEDIPSPPPSPSTGQGQEILLECLRSGRAFVEAMEAGDPLIMEALAAFERAGEAGAATSPRPSSMDQDPQIEEALDRFQRSLGK